MTDEKIIEAVVGALHDKQRTPMTAPPWAEIQPEWRKTIARAHNVPTVLTALEAAGYEVVEKGQAEEMAAIGLHAGYAEAREKLAKAEALAEAARPFSDLLDIFKRDLGPSVIEAHLPHGEASTLASVDLADVQALDAALSAFQQGGDGWRPIESAPRDGTPILGWRDDAKYPPITGIEIFHWSASHSAWFMNCRSAWIVPTHWRPLPAPPRTPS